MKIVTIVLKDIKGPGGTRNVIIPISMVFISEGDTKLSLMESIQETGRAITILWRTPKWRSDQCHIRHQKPQAMRVVWDVCSAFESRVPYWLPTAWITDWSSWKWFLVCKDVGMGRILDFTGYPAERNIFFLFESEDSLLISFRCSSTYQLAIKTIFHKFLQRNII